MTGTIVIAPESTYINGHQYPTPAGLCRDRSNIAKLLAEREPAAAVLEIDPADPDLRWAMGEHGWKCNDGAEDFDGAWYGYRHTVTHRWMHLVQRDNGIDDMTYGLPADVADKLWWWDRETGAPYRISPAVSAIASIRAAGRRTKTEVRWQLQDKRTLEWWTPPGQIHDLDYGWVTREVLDRQEEAAGLHRYDMRGAYLAHAALVELPHRQIKPTGPDVDAYTTVGYYHVRLPLPNGPLTLYLHDVLGTDHNGLTWVCHPTLRLLLQNAAMLEIIDSHTRPLEPGSAGRILRPWAERWRDARDAAPRHLEEALKSGYAQALGGLLAVPRGTVYRPDWRHMIMDSVRASLLRRIIKVYGKSSLAGHPKLPKKIWTDALYYREPVEEADLGVGPHIGNMRYEGARWSQ